MSFVVTIPDQDKEFWIQHYKTKAESLERQLKETRKILNTLLGNTIEPVDSRDPQIPDIEFNGKRDSIGWKYKIKTILEQNEGPQTFTDIWNNILLSYQEFKGKEEAIKSSLSSCLSTNSGEGRIFKKFNKAGVFYYELNKGYK